jgi:hypothetical protein
MTSVEADNLIASLPKPGGLRLFREGDRITMDGGKWGPHSLSVPVSNGQRLLAHWKGYVENQGLSLGPDYGRTEKPRSAAEAARDFEPGDKVTFYSASYSAAGGWRPGTVVRATPKRVLVEYVYKYVADKVRRERRELRPHEKSQSWRKRSEVRRVTTR